MSLRALTPLEARVLGVLVEKQATVPDTYPMSLNALVNGCNQRTAREPVMDAADADVMAALDGLKALALVFETSGSRVSKYEHNAPRALGLPGAAVALLATLVLRGPQTGAELRAHSERLHRFADLSSVEGFLDELALRQPPRVRRLARAPGEREARWVHLLCGEPQLPVTAPAAPAALAAPAETAVASAELAALKAEVARQAARLDELEALVRQLVAAPRPH
jgi:uncharacterized protein YceH (UPF0502 family)